LKAMVPIEDRESDGSKWAALRRRHRRFSYESFSMEPHHDGLSVRFVFEIEPGIRFTPSTTVSGIGDPGEGAIDGRLLERLLFHVGLIEAMSYWKAACCPEILIRAGQLDDHQLAWYKDLLIRGMGEYFYVNGIPFDHPEFLHIFCDKAEAFPPPVRWAARQPRRGLLLQSGGKDSALSVQLLREAGEDFNSLMMNPPPSALEISRMGGLERPIIIRRDIDPKLLEINRAGYLNGHTPFSALLAFWGITCAALAGYENVMVANERSADEMNLEYLGREINHQYSKSFPFEVSFREYCRTYLTGDISFFSLLRPLYEIQIARLFARYPRYFPVFKSCNRNQKENTWCGRCPKCVSTFILLYPFLGSQELIGIFGRDLFEDDETVPVIRDLAGLGLHKPFECVGTRQETLAALNLALERARGEGDVPPVLGYAAREILPRVQGYPRQIGLLDEWGRDDHLPARFAALLKSRLGGSV
jgi:hypothetical protein